MSPSRRRKSTRQRRERALRLSASILLMVALAGTAALLWLRSDRGEIWLAERGVKSAQQHSARLFEQALLQGLADCGTPSDSIVVRPGHPSLVEVGATGDLRDLNLAVTTRLQARGGQVQWGEGWEKKGSSVLELRLGGRNYLTHRLIATRGPRAAQLKPPPPPAGLLAIVVDDWGHNLNATARAILDLPVPITVAILPERPKSLRVLNEARRAGKEAILHMPMQPVEGSSPGPGEMALTVEMSDEEIRRRVERCLDGLPEVVGMNNHMGSEFTQHRRQMDAVMEVLAERGLFFLDSLTTPRSVGLRAARAEHVPALRNELFLDLDVDDPAMIRQRLERLIERARRKGRAVGIGHLTPATARVLGEVLPALDPQDVRCVFLSEVLRETPSS